MSETAVAELPRDFDGLRALILSQRESLPKRIAQIAAYALDNPDEIAFGTAASIAVSAGVQPSTLIRFAQHLGFDGFTSLQAVFRERLRGRNSSYEERLAMLRGGDDGAAGNHRILDGLLTASRKSLDMMSRTLDEATLDRAIAVLARAETIHILARRRSYPVASYLAYALGKLKVRNQLIESAAGLDPEMIAFATPKDAVIVVSFSPYAPATIADARGLAERGVPLIAITDSAFSPLAGLAKLWFEVAEADFGGFRTLASTMALAMALAVGIGEARRSGHGTPG
ncbi:MurR/RpiR family transcriptional regulator [Bosea sp. (in: a-proteobacteria)]|uniref:MurR/RpiR family transcriptional regulator n=1 Tax=Bosea sp. (in: a-proteobacteria) TaxID=1871050 RepID=UPI00262EB76E|nr:MurR/RpiR family transcriptional regulator [Bosea sp. (in: a-proteobacteria)]MCO5091468.1 MurR/RpiR family transcriptional regulator [Bosea sp. (in: a-proteobacteria)]